MMMTERAHLPVHRFLPEFPRLGELLVALATLLRSMTQRPASDTEIGWEDGEAADPSETKR